MRLSTHDASFVYGETANGPMHGVSLTLLDGAVSYDEIFAYYEPRVGKIPRLRQKLAFAPFNLAHPRWVDDPSFDLRNHLIGHRLAPNTTLAQAEAKALELAQGVLDRNRPLWRTFVLEGVEGRTLIASLTHHAFVDGATAVALSTVLTDPSPDPEPQEAAPAWSPEPAPSLLDRWIDAGSAFIEQGAENLRRMRQLPAAEPSRLARVVEALAQPVMQAPWNRSLVGPKRQLAYFTVGLEDIKRIRSAHGGTVNDVAVSTVMEGVANYLAARKEPLDEQFLRLMCPVNVRSEDDDALSMSGNRVSALFPRFEAQPLGIPERLRRVRTQLQALKAEGQAEAVEQLQHSAPELPPVAALATQVIGTRFDPTAVAAAWPAPVPRTPPPRALPHLGFNFTVTNVPGPFWTQYVAGHRVINQYGTLMLGGTLGMGVTANSYAGQLTIGFTADPRLVPDVEALRDSAEQAFQALLDASTPQAADQAEAEAAVDIEERAA